MGDIATVANAYAALARNVTALSDATRTKPVADIGLFLKMGLLPAPFCLFVPDGEEAARPAAIRDTGAMQDAEQTWSAYLGAASFGPEGEGAFAPAAGVATGEDAFTLILLLIGAVQGKTVYQDAAQFSRAFYSRWGLYDVTESAVIYRVQFFNEFVRIA